MSLLEVTGLSKSYVRRRDAFGRVVVRHRAVRDASLYVDAGETLAVVGESGAGKSTLGRLVLRLIEPDEGRVVFDGTDVAGLGRRDLRTLRRRMQMIFQDPHSSLDPRLPVGVSVGEPMLVHFGTGRAERERRAAELLDRVGLPRSAAHRHPGELSGGQLQRVAIARALALEPALIVCDEPVAALDVSVRAQVLNLMHELQNELGLAYLFISHDLALVEVIADRVAVMRQGEIIETGTAAELYRSPRHDYTRDLLAAVPVPMPPSMRAGRGGNLGT
ncbi:ATP-binding cassette domain-containing protein [Streptomyces sp. NBC_00873]|uniref:ATP-binding cassette domain-containing protein n=1 Tax=unclassified Streptomyces TaxID=2593676 RepID=UPI003867C853|nr:ATP-binding cassette domain-containing protein [Streptomyces sp. NBC_00873]WTA41939.1 ATP-binding cassette domain-containing protein [Streptomyces sp. NBC_00842]